MTKVSTFWCSSPDNLAITLIPESSSQDFGAARPSQDQGALHRARGPQVVEGLKVPLHLRAAWPKARSPQEKLRRPKDPIENPETLTPKPEEELPKP